jgi:hypothetical protein
MKHKFIVVASITVLMCLVMGNTFACTTTPATKYDLTIDSTEGGSVTTPVEGTHTCDEGTVVNLVATPDADYYFVRWTGDVGTIANVNDASTNITMNGDYTITANFGFDMTFIADVPDTNQPPTQTLPSTVPSNYCAPMAAVNIVYYWDVVMGHANAGGVTAGLIPETAAEYIGHFMDTNDTGSPVRFNGTTYPSSSGTYAIDIDLGILEFARWDMANPMLHSAPPPLPGGKNGYDWMVTPDYAVGFDFYVDEIDAGRPLVVCFKYWNPVDLDMAFFDPETGETIDVFAWGDKVPGSSDPEEQWNDGYGEECIGHAVTGVGYILNWDPDGSGPADYVIVHDNWSSTPKNVAIPWDNWNSSHAVML